MNRENISKNGEKLMETEDAICDWIQRNLKSADAERINMVATMTEALASLVSASASVTKINFDD